MKKLIRLFYWPVDKLIAIVGYLYLTVQFFIYLPNPLPHDISKKMSDEVNDLQKKTWFFPLTLIVCFIFWYSLINFLINILT